MGLVVELLSEIFTLRWITLTGALSFSTISVNSISNIKDGVSRYVIVKVFCAGVTNGRG